MRLVKYLSWLLRALLFAALFLFCVKNSGPVTVRFYFDQAWQAPLVLVLLAFFAFGIALGMIACLSKILGQRREMLSLRRELNLRSADRPSRPTVL